MSKRTDQLASDKVVVAAPMSYAGSAARIWKLTRVGFGIFKLVTVPAAVILVVLAWLMVSAWYGVFGLILAPYRLVRRSQRKAKRDSLRHQELLAAGRQ